MVLLDVVFHHGGEWSMEPRLSYLGKQNHYWIGYDSDFFSFLDFVNEFCKNLDFGGVQQLLVCASSGNFYKIEDDMGVRSLLSIISEGCKVVNLFAVKDGELPVTAANIIDNCESVITDIVLTVPDCSENDEEEKKNDYSSDESDCDEAELERLIKEKRRDISDRLNDFKELEQSMSWINIEEAREYMKLYALASSYGLKYVKNDKTRLRYKCREGCSFKCLISKDGKGVGVKVKSLINEHTCELDFENTIVDSKTVASYFKNKLQGNPKYKVREMRADLHNAFNFNSSHTKCKRAKRIILEKLHGSYTDEYNKIIAYGEELKLSNPGSDVLIPLSKDALSQGIRQFSRFYVCFKALKEGYMAGLRPFIGLDGTFLKGKAKGTLLAAVGQDAQNHFYPLAWAVVEKENKSTWNWFMTCSDHSLELSQGAGLTVISDMQKGLIDAIRSVLPEARYRFCAKHILHNWTKKYAGEYLVKLLWWSSWSSYRELFDDFLGAMKEANLKAAEYLVQQYPVHTWSRAFFDTVCKNQGVDNNFTESFNAWILEARHKPIIGMLEEIRIKVMEMLAKNESEVTTWSHDLTPMCMKLYHEYLKIGNRCKINSNGDDGFEVSESSDRHRVRLNEKSCTCRTWDLTGIPCPHAIKALLYKSEDPLNEVHWYYCKDAYLSIYKHKLQPVRGECFWKIDPTDAMQPPVLMKMVGRPALKRVRGKDKSIKRQGEWSCSRKGRIMSCSYCGIAGHNIRNCKQQLGGPKGNTKHKQSKANGKKFKGNQQPMAVDKYVEVPVEANRLELDVSLIEPQNSQVLFMYTSQALQVEDSDLESDYSPPNLRPKPFSEIETMLRARQQVEIHDGARIIQFAAPSTGLEPTNLPVKPIGLTYQGNRAMSQNHLEIMRQQMRQKLQPRRGTEQ